MRRNILVTVLCLLMLGGLLSRTPDLPGSFEPSAFSLYDALEAPLNAQAPFPGYHRSFTAQTATGQTSSSGQIRGVVVNHTIELITTGGPSGCTYRLQGTRDAVTWFNISSADITCTSTTVAFEANKPAVQVRGNLLTLTGGTAPTVTLKYIGR